MKKLIFIFVMLTTLPSVAFAADEFTVSNKGTVKKERNFIAEGNKAFADSNFVKAIEFYNKALAASEGGSPDLLLYNIATARFAQAKKMQSNTASGQADQKIEQLFTSADSIFNLVIKGKGNLEIREYSAYNAGNLAYFKQQYDKSIDYYKASLRLNPSNDKARQNLRLAQLKKQEQEQQNENQDQDQNQDQNQDKNKQQDQQQQQQQDQQRQNQQPQPQPKISQQNAEQVLKAMENAEQAVRRRHEQNKDERQVPVNPAVLDKPW